jgi:GAF domain-containing protein
MNNKGVVTPIPKNSDSVDVEDASFVYSRWREKFLRPILLGSAIFGLFALIPGILTTDNPIIIGVYISVYAALLIVVIFNKLPYWLRTGVFLFLVFALGASGLLETGIWGDSRVFFLAFIILSTIMLSPRAGAIATTLSLVSTAIVGYLVLTGHYTIMAIGQVSSAPLSNWISGSAALLLLSVIVITGLRLMQKEFIRAQEGAQTNFKALQEERAGLADRVAERTAQLEAVNEVGRIASSILDPDELAKQIVGLITERFGHYYAALFLVDETGKWANLKAATGEAGRLLMESKHRLEIGGHSMVGTAIDTHQARIALDVGSESIRFSNPLLPYTKSEIAIPLSIGDRVIGALDVQSTKDEAFNDQDINTFQGMAIQVAIALENAHLFKETQENLQEISTIHKQYISQSWGDLLQTDSGLQFATSDNSDLDTDSPSLNVPLALREQVIGEITMEGEEEWSQEERGWIEAVATQAALALENARLIEETQQTALSDHLIAEITSKIWSSTTINGILQTAVKELGQVLDVSEASIELKMDEEQ